MDPIEVAIAVIIRDGRLLISQRLKNGTFADHWEFPGGKREPGESPEQSLARELDEELGIRVHVVEALPPLEHDYPSFRVRLLPYVCTIIEGKPRPLASRQLAWITPEQLREYKFPPANAPLLDQILARFKGGTLHG